MSNNIIVIKLNFLLFLHLALFSEKSMNLIKMLFTTEGSLPIWVFLGFAYIVMT